MLRKTYINLFCLLFFKQNYFEFYFSNEINKLIPYILTYKLKNFRQILRFENDGRRVDLYSKLVKKILQLISEWASLK